MQSKRDERKKSNKKFITRLSSKLHPVDQEEVKEDKIVLRISKKQQV